MARVQLRPNRLEEGEESLEGELYWDDSLRAIGHYNTFSNDIDWFRLPRTSLGESISYIPLHQIDAENYRVRFQNSDGEFGDWLVAEKGDVGPPANINMTFEFVETVAEGEVTLEGTAPNYLMHLKLPQGKQGDPGDNSVLPIVSVAMLPTGSSPALVNTGTVEVPAYRLDIPYGSRPVDYSILIEDTNEEDIIVGEYFVTRFNNQDVTATKLLAEIMVGTGSVEIYLLVDGLAVAGPLTVTASALNSIDFSMSVAKEASISFLINAVDTVSSVWIQLVGETV